MKKQTPITKADFLRHLKCPLYAWLWKNRPELRENHKLSRLTEPGNDVEAYARDLFERGKPIEGWDEEAVELTKTAMEGGEDVIYQGAVMSEGLLARADILRRDDKGWHLYEVKSSTHYRDKYFADICYQLHVFRLAGFPLASVNLIIINKNYRLDSKKGIEPGKFLIAKDVTAMAKEKLDRKYELRINEAKKLLNDEKEPYVPALKRKIEPPMPKAMYEHYWRKIPELSIYDISGIQEGSLIELERMKIRRIIDIPGDFPLPKNQRRQVELTKRREVEIDSKGLEEAFSDFEYPLYFLDYEAITPSIPLFDGTRPNERIPCQYSLHIIDKPEGRLRHLDYLHSEKTHPVAELLESLREHMGDTGTVVVWNSTFESECNRAMGSHEHKYKQFMASINLRMRDLMKIVRDNYTDYRFRGSISIKNVLPVIAPDLSYKELAVKNGSMAMDAIIDLLEGKIDDRDKAIENLRTYCQLDTFAMVTIHKHLMSLI